ncbi:phage shock protein C (PspC) family protein [Haloactinospora alba]|uniref:Phage shock protein C (PspC) family protein n=1 Tax=Haloactinospora alba TaxID=405555 RepID=A0A543NMB2_9ACTN|nr:ATP-binding protein [Haloactinospora alba]TQN32970.1 phage shock protein C (PspC) family protein [Haloactinospora alba]
MDTAAETPRLYRARRGQGKRLLCGIGYGLARHLGVDPVATRIAFLVLGTGGIGIAVYIALIFFIPVEPEEGAPEPPWREPADETEEETAHDTPGRSRGWDTSQVLAYVALALGLGMLLLLFGGFVDPLLWFLILGALGGTILWQQANPTLREGWISASAVHSRRGWLRITAGILLVTVGVFGFLAFQQQLHEARAGLTFAVTILAGIALIAAPWIVALARERDRERGERIRNQERAELAAHIHDSVLQTLTLIQRSSEDPREVHRLARVQERALRNWLYQRPADSDTTLTPALERAAADVEEAHGVSIEAVCVGDCALDPHLTATLEAAREAMVNSAKYSGVESISVFGEVAPEEVLVFVRDRGAGFDMNAVPDDRMGVRGSIIGRMERHGGSARIRTSPGEGTEVQLRMPRGGE